MCGKWKEKPFNKEDREVTLLNFKDNFFIFLRAEKRNQIRVPFLRMM